MRNKISRQDYGRHLYGPKARLYAFAIFVFIVFLTGGGSRDDIQSLTILRPLSILFVAYAIIATKNDVWKITAFPVIMLLLLASIMVIQLIPLPPSIWAMLPNRQIYFEIARLSGLEQPWRPLTLSPSSTLNSLFSLSSPLAAMLLYLNLEAPRFRLAVLILITAISASIALALLQILGGFDDILYFYRITNETAAVGLFANRNHQSLMLVLAILLLGWYGSSTKKGPQNSTLSFYAPIAMIILLVPLIFVTGSRAGLVLMLPACAIALYFYFSGSNYRNGSQSKKAKKKVSSRGLRAFLPNTRRLLLLGSTFGISAMIGLSIYFSRSLALDRLMASGGDEELRGQLFPVLMKMLNDHFAMGIGFGSFEHIYESYETIDMLRPSYLNEAHNDVMQFVIEGGIPAMLVSLVVLGWIFRQVWRLVRHWKRGRSTRHKALMCFAIILFIFAASLWDYPLRVPSVMTVLAIVFCLLIDGIAELRARTVIQGNERENMAVRPDKV